jgi:hypothetical protein
MMIVFTTMKEKKKRRLEAGKGINSVIKTETDLLAIRAYNSGRPTTRFIQ